MIEEDGWTEDLPWIGQYVLDEDGKAVPAKGLLSWANWMEDKRRDCILARDVIGSASVRTDFLGLDQRVMFMMSLEGFDPIFYRPTLWETMVFGGPHHLYQERYTSREDALVGHRRIVQMIQEDKPA